MQLAQLAILSKEDILQIHQASLDILEDCGVKIGDPGTFSFLKDKGLLTNRENQVVRFSRSCIEDALSRIPLKFEVFDREGKPAFVLGDGVPRIASGHNAVFWVDSEAGVPIAILPEPNAGVSCPYTLAGLLTINNAECLSGIAIIQSLRPGAKVIYANSWTTTDIRTGAALVGSAETSACRIAGAQLARFYRIPSHTTAPNSDNHAHDEQNAWEKILSLFTAVASGNNRIVNCGMFATGLTCSHEQLLMDEEMVGMARRIAAGIEVNKETVAGDLIKEMGPAGTGYLTADHTLKWLRFGEYFVPGLAVRGPRAAWEAAGSKDTYQIAREKFKELRSLSPLDFDSKRKFLLEKVIRDFNQKGQDYDERD